MPRIATRILFAFLISALPALAAAEQTGQTAPLQAPPVLSSPATPPTGSAPAPATPSASPEQANTSQAPVRHQPRIGYIDIARISTESSLGKASATQAKQRQARLQSQITAKRKQLDRQKKTLEAQFPSLSPAQREAKAKEFQKRVESFQKFGMSAEKEMQTLQQGLGKSFNEALQQAATRFGADNNLDLIVLKREILYQSSSVDARDVSEGIIKLMNEQWGKK